MQTPAEASSRLAAWLRFYDGWRATTCATWGPNVSRWPRLKLHQDARFWRVIYRLRAEADDDDPRYKHVTCPLCGQSYQRMDYRCAAHELTCGHPIPEPEEVTR
jgi:hypothetical protein